MRLNLHLLYANGETFARYKRSCALLTRKLLPLETTMKMIPKFGAIEGEWKCVRAVVSVDGARRRREWDHVKEHVTMNDWSYDAGAAAGGGRARGGAPKPEHQRESISRATQPVTCVERCVRARRARRVGRWLVPKTEARRVDDVE